MHYVSDVEWLKLAKRKQYLIKMPALWFLIGGGLRGAIVTISITNMLNLK
jgi:hypothetical protein